MDKRITIYDLAKRLGISTGTINRALNGKPEVSEKTRKLVLDTAREMGFKPNKVAKSLARRPKKIAVVVNGNFPNFYNEIIRGAMYACNTLADFNIKGEYFYIGRTDNKINLIRKLEEIMDSSFDGLVLLPNEDNENLKSIIDKLFAKRIPVVTVATDIPQSKRICSVRQEGSISGGIAARLLSWMSGGSEIALFVGSKSLSGHAENIQGFMNVAKNTSLKITNIIENHDEPEIAYLNTERILTENSNIKGIYINSSNSLTVCKKIEEMRLGGQIKLICSDIYPELAEYIRKGIVHASIFQDPFYQGKTAVEKIYDCITSAHEASDIGGSVLVNPQIILDTNVEKFASANYDLPSEEG